MNIIVCDDNPLFRSSVATKIQSWAEKNNHSNAILIHTYASCEDALDAWENGLQIDALFLDIQIPGEMSGLEFAQIIRKANEYIPIVFITSYSEYAEDGYTVNALRYLRKPISDQPVAECLDLMWRQWSLSHTDCVFLDLPTQILRLPVNSIMYAEISGHACILKTTDREAAYQFRQSMDYIRQKLPATLFAQCHRSYLVNLMYIRHISNGVITMADGTTVQIGRKYQQEFMRNFRAYYLPGRKESR